MDGNAEIERETIARQPRLRTFSRSLPMSLLKAREAVMGHFRPKLRAHDLTEQQWRVLRALNNVERIETLALAETTFLHPPSLSRILVNLDARGLIARSASKEDLRRGYIAISARGRKLIEDVGEESERIYAEIARRYGVKKLAALEGMLEELRDALAAPIDAGRPGPTR